MQLPVQPIADTPIGYARVIIDTELQIEGSVSYDLNDIDSYEMSQCVSDEDSCNIVVPEIEEYIRPDWEDIEVSSDCEENLMLACMKT